LKIIRLTILVLALLLSAAIGVAQTPQSSTPTSPAGESDCTQAKATVGRLETRLRDWPALGRYSEDNRKTTAPAKNEKRVVFMGDSITDGWDDPQYGGFFPGKPYVNRGIGGQTTPQMLIRFRSDVIALKPEVVVILAGTNDIAGNTGPMTLEQIEGNLTSMAELARLHGIRVVLASSGTTRTRYWARPTMAGPRTSRLWRVTSRLESFAPFTSAISTGTRSPRAPP
jgi:hypothetical protein